MMKKRWERMIFVLVHRYKTSFVWILLMLYPEFGSFCHCHRIQFVLVITWMLRAWLRRISYLHCFINSNRMQWPIIEKLLFTICLNSLLFAKIMTSSTRKKLIKIIKILNILLLPSKTKSYFSAHMVTSFPHVFLV